MHWVTGDMMHDVGVLHHELEALFVRRERLSNDFDNLKILEKYSRALHEPLILKPLRLARS